jgi:hypothetical protein
MHLHDWPDRSDVYCLTSYVTSLTKQMLEVSDQLYDLHEKSAVVSDLLNDWPDQPDALSDLPHDWPDQSDALSDLLHDWPDQSNALSVCYMTYLANDALSVWPATWLTWPIRCTVYPATWLTWPNRRIDLTNQMYYMASYKNGYPIRCSIWPATRMT